MSAISGMNISMKNNNRRTTHKAFSTISGESDKESKGVKVEEVSEEVLEEIRYKLKQQQKTDKIINVVCILIGIIAFIVLIWFSVLYFENDPGIGFQP